MILSPINEKKLKYKEKTKKKSALYEIALNMENRKMLFGNVLLFSASLLQRTSRNINPEKYLKKKNNFSEKLLINLNKHSIFRLIKCKEIELKKY